MYVPSLSILFSLLFSSSVFLPLSLSLTFFHSHTRNPARCTLQRDVVDNSWCSESENFGLVSTTYPTLPACELRYSPRKVNRETSARRSLLFPTYVCALLPKLPLLIGSELDLHYVVARNINVDLISADISFNAILNARFERKRRREEERKRKREEEANISFHRSRTLRSRRNPGATSVSTIPPLSRADAIFCLSLVAPDVFFNRDASGATRGTCFAVAIAQSHHAVYFEV